MINELELMRFECELSRVLTAKKEMQFKIKEHEVDIERIRVHISMQDKRANEVEAIIQKMKEDNNG